MLCRWSETCVTEGTKYAQWVGLLSKLPFEHWAHLFMEGLKI